LKKGRIAVAVAGLALLIALGCGGGGGDAGTSTNGSTNTGTTNGSTNGSTTGTITEAQRMAAIDAVENKFEELQQGGRTREEINAQLAAFMSAQPQYKAAAVDVESSTVYGEFVDGRLHLVANNRYPDETLRSDSIRPRSLAGADLPGSKQARLLHSFGPNFESQTSINNVSAALRASGYDVVAGAEGEASVDTLKSVNGDGFFYINTHGGGGRLSGKSSLIYGIQSSTVLTDDGEQTYKDDLDSGRLIYMSAPNGNVKSILGYKIYESDTRYAITGAFIEQYWQLAPHSIVYINACNSGDSRAAGFIFACHKKGAGVVFAWDKGVSSTSAYHSIQYFADRLLGQNDFESETPKQRPFDWKSVLADMAAKGYDTDGSSGAKLVAFPRPGSVDPEILNPSIETMFVDEWNGELWLDGLFGSVAGKVAINGTEVAVHSWTKERIKVALPLTGTGSCGPVQVTVDGHKSNVRNLTEWDVTLDYKFWDSNVTVVKVSGPVKLRFRADVGEFRTKPAVAPGNPVRYAIGTKDSQAELVASGTGTDGACSYTWSGSRVYPVHPLDTKRSLIAWLKIDPLARTGNIGLAYGGDGTPESMFHEVRVCDGDRTDSDFAIAFGLLQGQAKFGYPMPVENSPEIPLPSAKVVYGSDFTFGLQRSPFVDNLTPMRLSVASSVVKFPPAGDAPRRP
jgi:hypothetical protein